MKAKTYKKWLILWAVFDYNKNGEKWTVARFKNPNSAAMYTLKHGHDSVEMELCNPKWNVETKD